MTTDRKNFESHDFRAIIVTAKYPGVAYRLGTWFGSNFPPIHDGNSQSPEPLATRAFAGFYRVTEQDQKTALTTGLTTDRKIFDFRPWCGIITQK